MQGFAGERQTIAAALQPLIPEQRGVVEKVAPEVNPLSPLAGERVWPIDPAPLILPPVSSPKTTAACDQLIVNTELDVIVQGSSGTAEPWVVLWPIVYYDDTDYSSPFYSLVLDIGDNGDPSPNYDGFGQAFYMPSGLISILVEYDRKIEFANSIDQVYGELWTVDDEGFLDQYITGWNVSDTPAGWGARMFTINDGPTLAQMEGRLMALVLVNDTTDPTPGEITWFDDVTVTACYDPPSNAAYMPAVPYLAGSGPVCNPPSENPPDSWYTNRGIIQTSALCNTTLSQLDDRDYYSFVASQTGSHTVRLSNLPVGSNWAALVYNDTEPPPTQPTNGGACYTSQPGHANKTVVCTFTAGQEYVIKVSSGSTPMTGSYTLQVTRP
jgi:hypothetical protein